MWVSRMISSSAEEIPCLRLEFATIIGVQAQDIYEFPTVEMLEEMLLKRQFHQEKKKKRKRWM